MRSLFTKGALAIAGLLVLLTPAVAQDKLMLTTMSPGGSNNSEALFKPWAQRVNAAAGNTIVVEPRDGVTLANFGNIYDRVVDDVVQIGWGLHPFIAGKFPLSEIAGLPLTTDSAEAAAVALWRLYKSGILDNEYKDVVPLWMTGHTQYQIHFAKAPRAIDNLNGLKIMVSGRINGQVIERLGGTPISLNPQEIYEGLQRGTIDGAMISWSSFGPYKLQEVAKYHIEMPLGTTTSFIFMSRKKYEALPAAARKAIDDNSGEAQSRVFGKFLDGQAASMRSPLTSTHTIVSPSDAQRAQWSERLAPVIDDWAKGRNDGQKALQAFRTIYQDVKAGR